MSSKKVDNHRTIAQNRKAFHDYNILERVEAGLVLTGTEIKSIRAGRVNIGGAFVKPERRELWLVNCHIAQYQDGNVNNHDPLRPRKLLLHKEQVRDWSAAVSQKGQTIVPLRVYIRNHVAKVELGLARGKRQYDKRRAIIDRDRDREAQRAVRRSV